jgi:PKD repeat protein
MKYINLLTIMLSLLVFSACKKNPEANIATNKSVAETGEEIYFENESVNGMNFLWDFGDGTESAEKNPVKAFEKAGSYQVKLIAYSKDYSTDAKAFMNILINNANEKFIGNYEGDICGSAGAFQITVGPSGNEVFVEVDGLKLDASVSGTAIIIARKEMEEDDQKIAFSGSGTIAGKKLSMMLKVEFYEEEYKMWFPYFCSITGDKK